MPEYPDLLDRLSGALLGTALGDALGLPAEGMSAAAIERRFGRIERFHLLGSRGFVSDDTEQSALTAQSLVLEPTDPEAFARAFRRALAGWFLRLPFGIGLGTIRACLRIAIGLRRSGVRSAGNGAAMRSAILGVFFSNDEASRRAFGRALAQVTHTDPRAIEGALFVAELAAQCATAHPDANRQDLFDRARTLVGEPSLQDALERARQLALAGTPTREAAPTLGTTGFVVHTVPFAAFVFMRFGDHPLAALAESISAGGDTDSIAAILGGWVGALHGESALPAALVERVHDGPFGPSHLRCLARELATVRAGGSPARCHYSPSRALLRNLALYPVVLAHGLRRLIPW